MLTLFIALGIAVGAALAPRLIPLGGLRRARLAAYAMGACILLLMPVDDVWLARALLFIAGVCGGLFVVLKAPGKGAAVRDGGSGGFAHGLFHRAGAYGGAAAGCADYRYALPYRMSG